MGWAASPLYPATKAVLVCSMHTVLTNIIQSPKSTEILGCRQLPKFPYPPLITSATQESYGNTELTQNARA